MDQKQLEIAARLLIAHWCYEQNPENELPRGPENIHDELDLLSHGKAISTADKVAIIREIEYQGDVLLGKDIRLGSVKEIIEYCKKS